jgi:hypothetical protein
MCKALGLNLALGKNKIDTEIRKKPQKVREKAVLGY